jgi:hypothetical protein
MTLASEWQAKKPRKPLNYCFVTNKKSSADWLGFFYGLICKLIKPHKMEFKPLYYPGFVVAGMVIEGGFIWTIKMLCIDDDIIRFYFWMN